VTVQGKKVAVLMEADYYEPCRRRLDGAGTGVGSPEPAESTGAGSAGAGAGPRAEVPALPALERK